MSNATPHIGFIGLGAMGQGMAASLLRAGLPVTGYDVNPAALATFSQSWQRLRPPETAAGGQAAASPAAAAQHAVSLVIPLVKR